MLSLKYDYIKPMLKDARAKMAEAVYQKDKAIKEKAASL